MSILSSPSSRGAQRAPAALLAVLALAAALTASTASHALAQAGGCPDGFAGPCCGSANPQLPTFPQVTWQDARRTCWIDCGPFPSALAPMTLGAPLQVGCGVYDAQLSGPMVACPAPGGPSQLRLYYTRRWQQAHPLVGPLVVHRFVAVGNTCLPPHPAATCNTEPPPAAPFVFGFVDYAFRKVPSVPCGLQFYAAALAIGHPCDRFVHDPACPFTADPLPPTHPVDQFTIVAPGTNFQPNAGLTPPSGPLLNVPRQALRFVRAGASGTCQPNERFQSLNLVNHGRQCSCVSPTLNQGPFWRQSLDATTTCGTRLQTSPLCPFAFPPPPMTPPFPTLHAWSVGRWTGLQFPALPGGHEVFLTQGSGTMQRPATAICPQVGAQRGAYYGAETKWGGPNGQKRVDLVDNVDPITGTTQVLPVVGGPGQLGTHVAFWY